MNVGLPRGGALCPPAVGPSMMNPSTLPLAFFSSVAARTFDAMIGRNRGRSRGGRSHSMKSRGLKCIVVSSPSTAPDTYKGYVAGSWLT